MHGRGPFAQSARERGRLRLHLPHRRVELRIDRARRPAGAAAPARSPCATSSSTAPPRPACRPPSSSLRRPLVRPWSCSGAGSARSASPRSSPALPSHPRRRERRSPSTRRRAGARDRHAPAASPRTVATAPPTFSSRSSALRASRSARESSSSNCLRRGCYPRLLRQLRDELREPLLHVLELVPHRDEAAADVLDRVALRHHPLDERDPAHDRDRVEPGRPGVLALAAHPPAPRQQPHLHVLPEGRGREPRALRLEQADDLTAGDPSGALPLEAGDLFGPEVLQS